LDIKKRIEVGRGLLIGRYNPEVAFHFRYRQRHSLIE